MYKTFRSLPEFLADPSAATPEVIQDIAQAAKKCNGNFARMKDETIIRRLCQPSTKSDMSDNGLPTWVEHMTLVVPELWLLAVQSDTVLSLEKLPRELRNDAFHREVIRLDGTYLTQLRLDEMYEELLADAVNSWPLAVTRDWSINPVIAQGLRFADERQMLIEARFQSPVLITVKELKKIDSPRVVSPFSLQQQLQAAELEPMLVADSAAARFNGWKREISLACVRSNPSAILNLPGPTNEILREALHLITEERGGEQLLRNVMARIRDYKPGGVVAIAATVAEQLEEDKT
ncbi:MAG: hypothetical protein Q8K86_05055 [Candidatus Nanopelagicaceae bacterium]|nr:hypothetical protein [Candidatus Nanopelagicaceae bacterium]